MNALTPTPAPLPGALALPGTAPVATDFAALLSGTAMPATGAPAAPQRPVGSIDSALPARTEIAREDEAAPLLEMLTPPTAPATAGPVVPVTLAAPVPSRPDAADVPAAEGGPAIVVFDDDTGGETKAETASMPVAADVIARADLAPVVIPAITAAPSAPADVATSTKSAVVTPTSMASVPTQATATTAPMIPNNSKASPTANLPTAEDYATWAADSAQRVSRIVAEANARAAVTPRGAPAAPTMQNGEIVTEHTSPVAVTQAPAITAAPTAPQPVAAPTPIPTDRGKATPTAIVPTAEDYATWAADSAQRVPRIVAEANARTVQAPRQPTSAVAAAPAMQDAITVEAPVSAAAADPAPVTATATTSFDTGATVTIAAAAQPLTPRVDAPLGDAVVDTTQPNWADQLADRVADLVQAEGKARFRLNPETLGSLHVEVAHSDDGVTIRFEVGSEAARGVLQQAEARLIADARAQGVRIADAQVVVAADPSAGNNSALAGGQQGDRRWTQPQAQQTAGRTADTNANPTDDAGDAGARYA